MIMQQKTSRSVEFEITSRTRESIIKWIDFASLGSTAFLFPSRVNRSFHLSSVAPKTYERYSSCLDTPSLTARFATWASKSTTPRNWPSKQRHRRNCGRRMTAALCQQADIRLKLVKRAATDPFAELRDHPLNCVNNKSCISLLHQLYPNASP